MNRLLEIALSQYGQKEIAGKKDNLTIVGYAKEAGHAWVNDDETPWCSIFMDWVCMKAGVERTHKANARSWLDVGIDPLPPAGTSPQVGEERTAPKTGDVVVLKRGTNPNSGHVGIYINQVDTEPGKMEFIRVLGGNQGNEVKISVFNKKDILGYRKLREV